MKKTRAFFALAVCLAVFFAACDMGGDDDALGGASITTLTIRNTSSRVVNNVSWNNVQFTGSNTPMNPGTSVTRDVSGGSGFVNFRVDSRDLRSPQTVAVPFGEQREFLILDSMMDGGVVPPPGGGGGGDSNGAQFSIGSTGPGGGMIFFAQGGQYMEVSGELGMHNWNGANEVASNFRGGGFSDWGLPDSGQLTLMRDNLHRANPPLGGFASANYWGSLSSANAAWMLNFGSFLAPSSTSTTIGSIFRVRAVRSFTAGGGGGNGGGALGTTLTIVNESAFYITHVRWGDVNFTTGTDALAPGGRSEMFVQPGNSFVRFRPRLNPFNLRVEQTFVVEEERANVFTILGTTPIVRELDNTTGTLASVAGTQLRIGDTGPGGGIIFFAQGGEFREVSGFLGLYNAANAITRAGNHSAGGFDDWVLPSGGNLAVMHENLHRAQPPLGGFTNARYWGARVSPGSTNSHFFDFDTGSLHQADGSIWSDPNTSTNMRVRAIRIFSVH